MAWLGLADERSANICVTLGGAKSVWEDFEAAWAMIAPRPFEVIACNEAGRDYEGELLAFATLHPEKIEKWLRERDRKGHPAPRFRITHREHRLAQGARIEQEIWHGSSGLYAPQVARLTFGFERIVVCGCPMDQAQAHYFTPNEVWQHAQNYRSGWVEAHGSPEIGGKFRSMSGWTRQVTGAPTTEWLDEVEHLNRS